MAFDLGTALPLLSMALALGLDSFRATIGLGALRPTRGSALRLAATFAAVEAVTPLIGAGVGSTLAQFAGTWSAVAGPVALALAGLYVLLAAARGATERPQPSFAVATLALPLSLSLDNLLAGGGLGLLGIAALPAAAAIGLTSGALALAGLALGAVLTNKVPVPSDVLSGLLLLAAAGAAALER